MKICSWDVGIKNLSYCILEMDTSKTIKILKWGIINLKEDKHIGLKCCCYLKKRKKNEDPRPCTRKPKYYLKQNNETIGYCETHKKEYDPCTQEWEDKLIQESEDKNKCCFMYPKKQQLCNKGTKYKCISGDNKNKHYCTSHRKSLIKEEKKQYELTKIKKELCKDINMHELARRMYTKMDKLPELSQVNHVYIENQPVKTNSTMKTVATIIFGYFVLRGVIDKTENKINKVDFANPQNKLKYDEKRTKNEMKKIKLEIEKYEKETKTEMKKVKKQKMRYDKRKELAIIYCNEYLNKKGTFKSFFNDSKKKDDLADSFLQGYYYLRLLADNS